jgi:hypothetical protein
VSAAPQTLVSHRASGTYKELDYYERKDESSFAGRERDIEQVVARVCTQRSLVVYGRSGLGKTSLLQAGVVPELERRGFLPIYVRTLDNPLNDLAAAIHAECNIPRSDTPVPLSTLIAEAGRERVPVIVLDQFEEFFIRFRERPQQRAAFVRELSSLITDPNCDFRVVFSLREEYLSALDDFQRTLPDLFVESYRLGPLTAFGAREAIVRPLINEGIPYDEKLVTALVDELAKFEFDSARLQVTCAELLESASSKHAHELRLTEQDFANLAQQLSRVPDATMAAAAGMPGGRVLEGVFNHYLARKIEPVGARWPLDARLVLEKMITLQDTKYAISLEELKAASLCPEEDLVELLQWLVDRKIVRDGLRGGQPWYELRHECLVPEIRSWLAQDKRFTDFMLLRGMVQTNARAYGSGVESVLDPDLLLQVRTERSRLQLSDTERTFLLHSAIQSGVKDDVELWAGIVGRDVARERISKQLAAGKYRVGPIRAAALFADEPGDLASLCLDVVFNESAPSEARSAAAETYSTLATEAQIRSLTGKLPKVRIPRHVADLLADIHDAGRARFLGGWVWRRRARRYSEARKVLRYSQQAQLEFAGPAAAYGLFAAVAWGVSCSAALMYLMNVLLETGRGDWLVTLGIVNFPVLLVAPLLGWRISVSASHVAAKYGEGRWFRTVRASRTLYFVLLAVTIVSVLIAGDGLDVLLLGVALGVPAAFVLRYAVAGVVNLTLSRIPPGTGLAKVLVIACASALVICVLLPLFLLPLLTLAWDNGDGWSPSTLSTALGLLILAQGLVSMAATVLTVALARRPTLGNSAAGRRATSGVGSFATSLALTAVLVMVFWVVHLRMWAKPETVRLEEGRATTLTATFHRWPQTHSIEVFPADPPALVEPRPSGYSNAIELVEDADSQRMELGERSLVFTRAGRMKFSYTNRTSFSEATMPVEQIRATGCDATGMPEGGVYFICPLSRNGNTWTAALTGETPATSRFSTSELTLYLPVATETTASMVVSTSGLVTSSRTPVSVRRSMSGAVVMPEYGYSTEGPDLKRGQTVNVASAAGKVSWRVQFVVKPEQQQTKGGLAAPEVLPAALLANPPQYLVAYMKLVPRTDLKAAAD